MLSLTSCGAQATAKGAQPMAVGPTAILLPRILRERGAVHAQVGLLRLTALAAGLGPGSAASGGARLMLWFLQCLLGHCLSAVNILVAGEVLAVLGQRPDVMDKYLGKGASLCSRGARQPGGSSVQLPCMGHDCGLSLDAGSHSGGTSLHHVKGLKKAIF